MCLNVRVDTSSWNNTEQSILRFPTFGINRQYGARKAEDQTENQKHTVSWFGMIERKNEYEIYPMSTSTRTTAQNVTTQVNDSNLLSLWNRFSSPACVYIPFKATMMMPESTHWKKLKN